MSVGMKDLHTALGDDAEKMSMHLNGDVIVVKPIEFLGKDVFARIARKLKVYGAVYHPKDQGGRFAQTFTVPTGEEASTPQIYPPSECPHIKTCSLAVDVNHAEHICLTRSWVHCEVIKPEELMQFKRKPSEWKQILGNEGE